jgi:cysteine-rich repeat protein
MHVEKGWACNETRCAKAGDGILTEGIEECDDANLRDGDGCSVNMTIEEGWLCVPLCTPSCCYAIPQPPKPKPKKTKSDKRRPHYSSSAGIRTGTDTLVHSQAIHHTAKSQ